MALISIELLFFAMYCKFKSANNKINDQFITKSTIRVVFLGNYNILKIISNKKKIKCYLYGILMNLNK